MKALILAICFVFAFGLRLTKLLPTGWPQLMETWPATMGVIHIRGAKPISLLFSVCPRCLRWLAYKNGVGTRRF